MILKKLPLPLIACLATFAFGGLFIPGDWYASLNRAPWSPPNIAFPIVWFILYLFIAISGWHLFSTKHKHLQKLWCLQLGINAIWSWVFFGQHWVLLGLINILVLGLIVGLLMIKCYKNKLAFSTYLLTPYLAWLALAASLNAYILLNN